MKNYQLFFVKNKSENYSLSQSNRKIEKTNEFDLIEVKENSKTKKSNNVQLQKSKKKKESE